MEISIEKINTLEKEVAGVKETLDNDILPLLQKIDRGLYGEKENEAEGLIKNQKFLQDEVNKLKIEIAAIHKKNIEQDIVLRAKKSIYVIVFEIVKYAALAYLVIDGVFGIDSLLKI